ncbi:MAG: draG [Herbinix sp.]|jgi:ADP-ribosylglycohydrolase|nr:draG [Herbinix sp.]
MDLKDRFEGCLLGGAIGDALGYPVEFMRRSEIMKKYGDNGITDLELSKETNKALVSDDTQMTLFTADGMIWAYLRCSERGIGSYAGSGTYQSYLRWYYTQTGKIENDFWLHKQLHEAEQYIIQYDKSIMEYEELYASRAPGNSCLSALGSEKMGTIDKPINDSKGCGAVMRSAPVGLFLHHRPEHAFQIGCEIAAITHGNPTGYLSAGTMAAIIAEIINGNSIIESVRSALGILVRYDNHDEILGSIEKAIILAEGNDKPSIAIEKLGEGWTAEEALAIAVYCALKEQNVQKALIMAVNHDGDSDSTGSICGNIIGAAYGIDLIPKDWIENIELNSLIYDLSGKLYTLSEYAFGNMRN